MSPFKNSLKTPEEIELRKKRDELTGMKERCSDRESRFLALKSEIRAFERVYEEILGSRIVRLEDLEWQLNGLLQNSDSTEYASATPPLDAFAHFHHRTDLLDDTEMYANHSCKSMKSIYREVAKAIHPDLAPDESERLRRQELMAVANHAYGSGDRQTLENLLADWEEQGPEHSSELDVALELVRVIREIARAEQNLQALARQIDELKATDIYQFKIRVDEAGSDGRDLLTEMAAAVELEISRTLNRLAVLRGDEAGTGDRHGMPLETRIVSFPADRICGTLYERSKGSVDYRDWKRLGNACGAREVFLDKSLRLDVKGSSRNNPAFLTSLKPHDLQSLFLYEVDDGALPYLANLSGLEELYLSNTTVSDNGLRLLAPLRCLKRLYVYHTDISDSGLMNLVQLPGLVNLTCSGTATTEEGLSRLRRIMPRCKTVSFKWRYDT